MTNRWDTVGRGPLGLVAAVAACVFELHGASQAPTFRAGVDHVAVDVIATDSHDRPVTDLTQQDFQIAEGGRPQTVADFEYVSIPIVHRSIDRAVAATAPPVDVAENTQSSSASRVWVMIVDDLHILPQFIVPVQRAMTEFLESLPPTDEVAITFVSRSDLSQNFTTDLNRLVKTIGSLKAVFGFGYGADAMTEVTRGSGRTGPNQLLSAARSAVFDLKNAAAALAGSGHARRAILYVSGQSVLDLGADMHKPEHAAAVAYQLALQDAFDAARRSDVPVYAIDPRGLVQPETATKGSCCTDYTQRAEIQRRIVIQQDWLASIATNTGGRFFINQNDIAHVIDDIVSENSSYYLLGYYPSPFVRDGKFHELKVAVSRPGVHVRAKTGYVAHAAAAEPATPAATLTSVLGTGFNVSGLPLRTFAAPIASATPGKVTVVVTTEVTLPSVAPGEPATDTLHWQVMALDPDGKVKNSVGNSAPITLSPAGSHIVVNDVLDLPAEALTIRVGVTSERLGKSGSVQLSAAVVDPSSGKLQVASVVLGVIDGRGRAPAEPESLRALIPFQPTTTRLFAPTDTLEVFAPTSWSGPDAAAQAHVSIRQGATVIVSQAYTLQGTSTAGDHRTASIRGDVPLANLSPGEYTLAVDVQLADKAPVTRTVPFEIKK